MIALETKWGELETITITCHRWRGSWCGGGEDGILDPGHIGGVSWVVEVWCRV